jgi:hypothetical protein
MPNLVALMFGAVIVAVFSYERFNQASYAAGRRLERLVSLLSPEQLRARRVVLKAYVLYAAALLLIYFFLCAYAQFLPYIGGPDLTSQIGASELPATSTAGPPPAMTGFVPGETFAGQTADEAGRAEGPVDVPIAASVSLTIALIMVGLAPIFPVLRRFEDWIRGAAHRLAGIPTRVIAASEELRQNRLDIGRRGGGLVPKDTLLIPRGNWERLAFYRKAAKGKVASPEEFHQDLEFIFAISAWVLDGKLKLVNTQGRIRFELLEAELVSRTDVLILELDEESGFRSSQPPATQPADVKQPVNTDDKAGAPKRTGWERIAIDAGNLADDLCTLLALYVEHEVIIGKVSAATEVARVQGSYRQQILASQKLSAFLGDLLGEDASSTRARSRTTAAFFWTVGAVSVVSIIWSFWPGPLEVGLQRTDEIGAYRRAWDYLNNALTSYCIPVLVVLAIRDAALQANRWQNMGRGHWTLRVPQAAFLVFASWALATVLIVGMVLWINLLNTKAQGVDYSIWTEIRIKFEYNGPSPLRGAVLGLIIVVLLDTRPILPKSNGATRYSVISSLAWATAAALIMGIAGGATRALVSWIFAARASRPLDGIDFGLIVYTSIYAAIIGFAVIFCVAEALAKRPGSRIRLSSPSESTSPPTPAPAPTTTPAPALAHSAETPAS